MIDVGIVLEFSATRLWLPGDGTADMSVRLGHLRTADASETDLEPGALVPRDDWGPIRTESDLFRVDEPFRTDRDVAVVRSPTREHIGRFGLADRVFGEMQDVPGLSTQTVNGDRRLGLHLDNWDRLPAERRTTSRNRISLNTGLEDRWFTFVDLDVVSRYHPQAVPNTDSVRIITRRVGLDSTVVRIRIPPGWAYIAPTELLLHDGYTVGQVEGSSHVTALGNFAPETSEAVGINAAVAQRQRQRVQDPPSEGSNPSGRT